MWRSNLSLSEISGIMKSIGLKFNFILFSLFTFNYTLLSVSQMLDCQALPILKLFIPSLLLFLTAAFLLHEKMKQEGIFPVVRLDRYKEIIRLQLDSALIRCNSTVHSLLLVQQSKSFYFWGFTSLLLETCLRLSKCKYISEAGDWILPKSSFPEFEGMSPKETMQPARIFIYWPPDI